MRIGIVGAGGRMGLMLVRALAATPGVVMTGGTERPGAPELGEDIAALAGLMPRGARVTTEPGPLFADSEAIIDFTVPAATVAHAALAAEHGTALVIGTTGLSPEDRAAIARAAQRAPIVLAANMSLGVNLLAGLVRRIAAVLGPEWDIEIVEMHHRHKVDAPSGTALLLGEAAAAGRGVELAAMRQSGRDGMTGVRAEGQIGFASLRGGDVVGEHTVLFAGAAERVELTHRATDRAVFAQGAVRAALWAIGKPPGLYGMEDVLGL